MKCKIRRDMRDEKRVRTKNGRSGISGMCAVCGGKIFRMVGTAAKTKGKISSKKRYSAILTQVLISRFGEQSCAIIRIPY